MKIYFYSYLLKSVNANDIKILIQKDFNSEIVKIKFE